MASLRERQLGKRAATRIPALGRQPCLEIVTVLAAAPPGDCSMLAEHVGMPLVRFICWGKDLSVDRRIMLKSACLRTVRALTNNRARWHFLNRARPGKTRAGFCIECHCSTTNAGERHIWRNELPPGPNAVALMHHLAKRTSARSGWVWRSCTIWQNELPQVQMRVALMHHLAKRT
jgi:hypothetical protein